MAISGPHTIHPLDRRNLDRGAVRGFFMEFNVVNHRSDGVLKVLEKHHQITLLQKYSVALRVVSETKCREIADQLVFNSNTI